MSKLIFIVFFVVTLFVIEGRCAFNCEEHERCGAWMNSFSSFARTYKKQYENYHELKYRMGVYVQNLKLIEDTNRLNLPYKLAMNHYGDWTNDEFVMKMNKFRNKDKKYNNTFTFVDVRSLPDEVDWRKKSLVTPVKDQGQCGSCWAFSAIGSTEGAFAKSKGKLVSLSEQNLVDCSKKQGNSGCNGGLMDYAFNYIIENKGIDTEDDYPYEATEGKCRYSNESIGATISSFVDVPSGSEDALTDALANIGPVSVAIDASRPTFQFYSSGVYFDGNCSSSQLDHGVLAVGYGSQDGHEHYIVKNSWGTTWGMGGYILMSRNKNNNCGIATAASYPVV